MELTDGAISRSKAQDLAELDNVELIELDVTIPETISQCKDLVTKRANGKLDVLVSTCYRSAEDTGSNAKTQC